MGHATLSPSAAPRWTLCAAAEALSRGFPDRSSPDAIYGTAAHWLAAANLVGWKTGSGDYAGAVVPTDDGPVVIDDEMRQGVAASVTYIKSLGGHVEVERSLPITSITGERDAHGTADAIVLVPDELMVVDLKFGRGVTVYADSDQLVIYGLAAMEEFSVVHDFSQVRLVIFQPRLGHVSEVVYTVAEMVEHRARIATAALRAQSAIDLVDIGLELDESHYNPGESQCKWCRAKAVCPALRSRVLSVVADDFVDLTQPVAPQLAGAAECTYDNALLGNLLGAVPLIEDWCKAIRARAESELIDGRDVPGWKLVEGKRGARAWVNPEQAEELMKSMRLRIEQMYDLKLISPTSAEKLAKLAYLGPRQWEKLKGLVVQPDGKPSVAPASDKRPAIQVSVSPTDFDNVAEGVSA